MTRFLCIVLGVALLGCSSGTSSSTTGGGTGGTTSGGGTTGGTGSSDPVVACGSYCAHVLSCLGLGSGDCATSCATYESEYTGSGTCSDFAALFNCLATVSCGDLVAPLDAGTEPVLACYAAGGCH
jgi:hypothetical protein